MAWRLRQLAPPLCVDDQPGDSGTSADGMTDALAEFIDGGRVKLFCVGRTTTSRFSTAALTLHRSWRQRCSTSTSREVFRFIYAACETDSIPIARWARRLERITRPIRSLRYPHRVKRVIAVGRYDLKRFRTGCSRQLLLHNPGDYMANLETRDQGTAPSCEI